MHNLHLMILHPTSSPTVSPQTVATAESLAPAATSDYQAPAIESVFTPDDLVREVLYAAPGTVSDPGPLDP